MKLPKYSQIKQHQKTPEMRMGKEQLWKARNLLLDTCRILAISHNK